MNGAGIATLSIVGLLILGLLLHFVALPLFRDYKRIKGRICGECAEFKCSKYNTYGGQPKYKYATPATRNSGELSACVDFVSVDERQRAIEITRLSQRLLKK